MNKEFVFNRACDKIAMVRKYQGNQDSQIAAYNTASGYLQALLETEIITLEEWRNLEDNLFRAFMVLD